MTLQEYAEAIRKGDDPLAVLRVAVSEAESSALERALGRDKPWPIADVLDKLADAAAHLLSDHSCDEHGWELVQGCVPRARAYATTLRALIPPAAAPAADYDPITAPIPEGDMNGPHGPIRTVPMMPVDEAADARMDALSAAQPREKSRPLDELAAVLRGKDEMGEKLAKTLGVPAGPLGRLVDAAVARIAELERRVDAGLRLAKIHYQAWAWSGGDPECGHGVNLGIHCAECDRITLETGAARVAPPEGPK